MNSKQVGRFDVRPSIRLPERFAVYERETDELVHDHKGRGLKWRRGRAAIFGTEEAATKFARRRENRLAREERQRKRREEYQE